jgi:WD40 repeat protein
LSASCVKCQQNLVGDPGEARRFLDALYMAATMAHSPVRVLITLRADFYDRPLMIPDFSELVRQRTEVVTPMTPEELERAVTAPAERVGVSLEPGLAAAVVAEVSQQPGALPLMEYALTEVFDHRTDHTVTLAAYEDVGGALGALARRADQVYARLTPERQAAARQMCLRLVTLGEGTEDTRRRTLQSELLAAGGEAKRAVLHAFDRARLLTFDRDPRAQQPTVELAHEAIIREWALLRTWLDESRDDIRQQRLLATAANEWEEAGWDRSYLLTGSRLAQFEGWAEQTDVALTPDERAFLEASSTEDTRQKSRRRRARNLAFGATAAVALLMTVLSIIALNQRSTANKERNRTQRQADVNHSLVLATAAQLEYDKGYTSLALALALEATNMIQAPSEAVRALSTVALGPGTQAVLAGHHTIVRAIAFSPDGHFALSGSCAQLSPDNLCTDGELILWDTETKQELKRFGGRQSNGHLAGINTIVFVSSNPLMALSGSGDGTIILWNVDTGEPIRRFAGHDGAVNRIALSPDGRTLLSGSDDATIILWDLETAESIRRFENHSGPVNCVAFSPDGQRFLSGSDDMTVILWDVATGEALRRFEGHTNSVSNVVFIPDVSSAAGTIISTGYDNTLRSWNLETGEEIREANVGGITDCLAITPDGRTAVVCSEVKLIVWDLIQWTTTYSFGEAPIYLYSVALSPDGNRILCGLGDGTIYLWDRGVQAEVQRFAVEGEPLSGMAVSPNGTQILTGAVGEAILWDVPSHSILRRFPGQTGMAYTLAFSPDGRQALIGAADWLSGTNKGSLVLVDVETGQVIHQLEGHQFYTRSAAFSPDGRTALSGSQKYPTEMSDVLIGDLILWDLSSGDIIRRFDTVDDTTGIDFSADGSRAVTSAATNRTEGDVVLWDVATGTPIRHFEAVDTKGFFDITFGPDDKTILAATLEGSLILWDTETGSIIRRFIGHESYAWAVDISPDGRYVLSGDESGLIILWDFATGQELRRFTGVLDRVITVVFSPDGQTAFSAPMAADWVSQWQIADWPLDKLLAWVHENRYIRDFTCEERAQYRIEPLCE